MTLSARCALLCFYQSVMHLRLLERANLSAAAASEEIKMHHFHEKKK